MSRLRVLVVVVALISAGCTPSPHHVVRTSRTTRTTPARSAQPRPALRLAWQTTGFGPVSPVKVLGRVALGYGVVGKRLYLYGLRTDDGRVLWRHAASTSATTQGVDVGVTTIGGLVTYFGPLAGTRDAAARLVAAVPATGRVVASSVRMEWASTPHPCERAPNVPCATAYTPQAHADVEYRLNLRNGSIDIVPGDLDGYREVGDELVDPLSRAPEYVERRAAGRTVWTRRLSELFGPGTTTDSGWQFNKYGTVYTGTVYAGIDAYTFHRTERIDLARQPVTAGFRAADGALLWRRPGTSVDCAGTLSTGASRPVPVRCRYTGTITLHYPPVGTRGTVTSTTSGLAVTIEGFDPQTGRTTWSRPMGATKSLFSSARDTELRTDTDVLIGTRVLELRTGRFVTATRGDTFWCRRQREFAESPATIGGKRHLEVHLGTVAEPCDVDGRTTAAPPTSVPSSLSDIAGDLRIVATPTAVRAYRSV